MLRRALLTSAAVITLTASPFVTRVFAQSDMQPAPPATSQDDDRRGAHSAFYDDHLTGLPLSGGQVSTDPAPAGAIESSGQASASSPAEQGYYYDETQGYAPVTADAVDVGSASAVDVAAEAGTIAMGMAESAAYDSSVADDPPTAPTVPMADAAVTAPAAVVVVPRQGVTQADYLREASASDQYEIQAAQIALQRSQSDEVRGYAQTMLDQHTQSSAVLTQAASQDGVQAPSRLPAAKLAMLQRLRDAPQDQFDDMYNRQQLTTQMNAVALHEGFAENGSGALQEAAVKLQPATQTHLDSAYAMSDVPVTLAQDRQAETQALAMNDTGSGRSFRGYSVVGPTRGSTATADVSSGPSDLSAPATAVAMTDPASDAAVGDLGRTTPGTDIVYPGAGGTASRSGASSTGSASGAATGTATGTAPATAAPTAPATPR
jgi:putative membrane protein